MEFHKPVVMGDDSECETDGSSTSVLLDNFTIVVISPTLEMLVGAVQTIAADGSSPSHTSVERVEGNPSFGTCIFALVTASDPGFSRPRASREVREVIDRGIGVDFLRDEFCPVR